MAPAENGGIREQQDRQRDEARSERTEDLAERIAHIGAGRDLFGSFGYFAGAQIDDAGSQDRDGGQCADDDRVGKDFKDAPEALHHGLLDVGSRVHHDGGAETGLIGENAAREALLHRHHDRVTEKTAADALVREGA